MEKCTACGNVIDPTERSFSVTIEEIDGGLKEIVRETNNICWSCRKRIEAILSGETDRIGIRSYDAAERWKKR